MTLSTVKNNISGKKKVIGMQRNSDCIHKSYTSKFRKNYPKGYVKNKVYKFTSEGMLEEASLCNCPF